MKITSSADRNAVLATAAAVVVLTIGGGAAGATAVAAAGSDSSAVDGVYRLKWSEQEFIAAGAPVANAHADLGYAKGNPIVVTMTLHEGHLLVRTQPKAFWTPCNGSYAVSGKTVSITLGPPYNCNGRINAHWSLQNGQLRLHVTKTDAEDTVFFGAKPWKKIG